MRPLAFLIPVLCFAAGCSKPSAAPADAAAAPASAASGVAPAASAEWTLLYDVEHPRQGNKASVPDVVKAAAAALPISAEAGKLNCRDVEVTDAVEGNFNGSGSEQAVLLNRDCDRVDVPAGSSRSHEVVSFVVIHAAGKVNGAFAVPESTRFGGVVRSNAAASKDAISLLGEHAGGGDCQGWLVMFEVDAGKLREIEHFERAYNCSCPDCKEGRGKVIKARPQDGKLVFDTKKVAWVVDLSCPCTE